MNLIANDLSLIGTRLPVPSTHGELADYCAKALTIKYHDAERRQARFVASTDVMDADGDIVEQSWDLKRFQSNPVILFGRNSRDLPIGKAADVRVVDGHLEVVVEFASKEANPLAEQVWQLVKEGVLRAVSVGFLPRKVRKDLREGKEVYVLSDNELYEVSVVPIPSNPEALAKMKAACIPPHGEQRSAPRGEVKNMDEKAIQAELLAEKEKTAALNDRCKALEAKHAAEKSRADSPQAQIVNRDLDALVGKKITPKEKESLAKPALLDADLYQEHLKAVQDRTDMSVLQKDILGPDPNPAPKPAPESGSDNGESLEALVQQRAFGK